MLILALNWITTRKYQQSGLQVTERGIFSEIDLATADSSESDESDESTDRSNSGELEDRYNSLPMIDTATSRSF